MDPERAARIEVARRRDEAGEAFRRARCPRCGRAPYTPEHHVFLTGSYACRNPELGVHRHMERKCDGCGDRQYLPALEEQCRWVGIG